MTRYWQAYLTYRVKLWLAGARIVYAYLVTVDRVDMEAANVVSLSDVLALQVALGFNYIAQDTCNGLMYDIQDVKYLLSSEAPFYRYASWRYKKASV